MLSDGPHGIRKQMGAGDQLGLNGSVPATCFPTAATIANSWDPELGEEIGRNLGEEAACQGVNVLLGPGMNIKRSPLCGRNFEYFSEDPYLAGKILQGILNKSMAKGKPNLNIIFITNMPFQAIGKMAGGAVSQEMCENIVTIVNGHAIAFFKGMAGLIGGYFRQGKILKKARNMK